MHGIRDPETLRDEPGVEFREQERVVDEAEFETVAEGAESQSGLVVVGVTDPEGRLLLVDSEYVEGWTLPNGPVGVDDDWAIAADRWTQDALGFSVDIGAPKLVIRTETRSAASDDTVVGYTLAFRGSLHAGMGGGPMGTAGPGGPPPGVGPDDDTDTAEGEAPPTGAPPGSGGAPAGPDSVAERADLEWFTDPPEDVAPGHDALVEFFLS